MAFRIEREDDTVLNFVCVRSWWALDCSVRTKPEDLSLVCGRGDYSRFRAMLDRERRRLLGRARRRIAAADVEECVETALELAFRRFPARRLRMPLSRWLDRLLDEAIRTKPAGSASQEDLADTA
jgi:hypothetical protein